MASVYALAPTPFPSPREHECKGRRALAALFTAEPGGRQHSEALSEHVSMVSVQLP